MDLLPGDVLLSEAPDNDDFIVILEPEEDGTVRRFNSRNGKARSMPTSYIEILTSRTVYRGSEVIQQGVEEYEP